MTRASLVRTSAGRLLMVAGLAFSTVTAAAAPNVTNATQKGSALLFPDIRVDRDGADWNTLIRLQNDGTLDVTVTCYWMDGNKNRVDFALVITRNQPAWFDARTGQGTQQINPFPRSLANGFDNPFLLTPPSLDEATDGPGLYFKGTLVCWATDAGRQNQVKWNHLSGTATLYHPQVGAYEYDAYAFFAPTGIDLEPVGVPGTLSLDGVFYDTCPLYQIGQFSPAPQCGNGIPAGAETCDDGNLAGGDGCSATCAIEFGFTCAGAPSVCTATCGDGVKAAIEACDDGNLVNGDGCASTCTVEAGFTCAGTTPSVCSTTCGDGILAGAEACDDGNLVNGDGCASTCTVEAGFTCVGTTPSVCATTCGDGILAGAEACDDGNLVNGDGCASTCTVEAGFTCAGTTPSVCTAICGDGILAGAEACDDGNTTSGDGCAATCTVEAGFTCAGTTPSVCTAICGDGLMAGAEACDDGNILNGDGCSTTCTVEAGFACVGTPSVCTATCGDGIKAATEACDDGNTTDGDGCSAACLLEKRVFVTSQSYNGNLGGLAGADAKCQTLANAAALGGTYKAWLSDSTGSPSTRFTQNAAYYTVTGTKVADNWADLTDGTLDAPINVTESNGALPLSTSAGCVANGIGSTLVWTNTYTNGTSSSASCSDWTSTSGGLFLGSAVQSNLWWTFGCTGGLPTACGDLNALYCFEQ